jgi:hypothetical protein
VTFVICVGFVDFIVDRFVDFIVDCVNLRPTYGLNRGISVSGLGVLASILFTVLSVGTHHRPTYG